MIQTLVTALCNTTEGILDGYEVVLASMAENKGKSPDELAEAIAVDVAKALIEKPALRRTVAMMCASIIAMDRCAQGEDYSWALGEARNLCLDAFNKPTFLIDAYRFFSKKKSVIEDIVEGFEEEMDDRFTGDLATLKDALQTGDMDALRRGPSMNQADMFQAMIVTVRKMLFALRNEPDASHPQDPFAGLHRLPSDPVGLGSRRY